MVRSFDLLMIECLLIMVSLERHLIANPFAIDQYLTNTEGLVGTSHEATLPLG